MGFDFPHTMAVAAHRGDSYNCYENTMAAFEAARLAGADMVETDVRMTADGQLILMHDESAFRTTGVQRNIKDMTLEEVLTLNAGSENSPAKVPTLEELLAWAARHNMLLNLELKEYHVPGNEERSRVCLEKVVELVRRYGLERRIVLNSFDAWLLEYADETYDHSFLLHGFYPYSAMKNVSRDPGQYLYCACIWGQTLRKENYDYLIAHGIEPWVGAGFTSSDRLETACRYGARLVTTNYPADAIAKLRQLEAHL